MSRTSREIQLAARPDGEPVDTDFRLAEVEVGEPAPGEVLVANTVMSVDPYMRGRMNDAKSYVPAFVLDAAMTGSAVGEVLAVGEGVEGFAEGDRVVHQYGWRDLALVPAREARAVMADGLPESVFLGVLGMPGLTAYAGLLDVGELREGDIVFVSGAAGAVGSLVGQMAKLRGHTVIGSAGSAEKIAHLIDDLGFDAAFNYRDGPVAEQLAAAAPDGIDLYFDNVGGEHLEAAIGALRLHGRAALCGAISVYNAVQPPPGPRNMFQIVAKRLTLRGFIIVDHTRRMRDLIAEIGPLVRDGRIHFRETVVDGLENAPAAFQGLLRGDNTGKMLVRI